jgi:hypothetical protein
MGLTDFLAGWYLGAKAGNDGFDDVVSTARGIFESKEFKDFLAAGRSHLASSLRNLGDLIDVEGVDADAEQDLIDFVQHLMARRDAFLEAVRSKADPQHPGHQPRRDR